MTLSHRDLRYGRRYSNLDLDEGYFWTDTIKNWYHLLHDDYLKQVIIDTLSNLALRSKIKVYGFVIMPNHMHCIWEMIEMVGKEKPYASFNKFTSHQFLKFLRKESPQELKRFVVQNDKERQHRFWQRDPLAIKINSKKMAEQKLDYIHLNPLNERWNLVERPEHYKWSSARFYETGVDQFGFLTHIGERF